MGEEDLEYTTGDQEPRCEPRRSNNRGIRVACDVWGPDDASNGGDCRGEGQHSCVPYLKSRGFSCVPSERLLIRQRLNGRGRRRQMRGCERSERSRRISAGRLRRGADLESEARDEQAELNDVYIEGVRSGYAYRGRG